MDKIGIVILGTNAYSILMIRFVKRFMQFYKGDRKIKFFLFSDLDPKDYLPEGIDYEFIYTTNKSWVDGTNLKFRSILKLSEQSDIQYLAYFDADTNINSEFTEEWFIGELVGGQHYDDESRMKDVKAYDRNPRSTAYIPYNTPLKQTYYYGAFFSGELKKMMEFCQILLDSQVADKQWGYEAAVNDESHINHYFHYNRPITIPSKEFKFIVSDKGGIGDTRIMNLDINIVKKDLLKYKNDCINIQYGKVTKDGGDL